MHLCWFISQSKDFADCSGFSVSKFVFLGISFAAECTAKEAFQYAGPNIIFASGSPFRDVDLGMNPSPLNLSSSPLNLSWYATRHIRYQRSPLVFNNTDKMTCWCAGGGKIGHSNQGNNMYFFPGYISIFPASIIKILPSRITSYVTGYPLVRISFEWPLKAGVWSFFRNLFIVHEHLHRLCCSKIPVLLLCPFWQRLPTKYQFYFGINQIDV